MTQVTITYANKQNDAAIGTIERTWRAEDANEVKAVVNALSQLLQQFSEGDVTPMVVVVNSASSVTVSHGVGRSPMIRVTDQSGVQVSVAPIDIDDNNTTIDFGESFSGTVIAM